MTNIRWGIVGTGSIATAFAHSIKYSNNSSLEAVYGRNESKLKDFCNKFEVEDINEPNNLFTADHIDAIYIATPHSTHYEYCLSAIRNKKHILCEKPLTVNHLESMVLLNLAKESNVFLMEAFMYRTHPQTANILDSLDVFQDSKEEIIIESSFGFTAELSESHRLRNPMLGGGAILDVGCYPLSISKLIAGRIQGELFSDPESIEASGRIDSTGVDLQSTASLVFSDRIKAEISCAIDEEYSNNLIVRSGDLKIVASQPWHCGQFQEGKSSIEIYKNQQLIKEIPFEDKVGLFTREINHASECIIKGEIESNYINHADTQSNMLWLEKWRQEINIVCPLSHFKGSPLPDSKFYSIQRPKLQSTSLNGVKKLGSRLALGCDNQTSSLHAFTMFDHFYGSGGRIFDTAYIYNNGKGDKYLGDWINSRNIEDEIIVLGKGVHTPDCEPKFIRPQIEESLSRLNINKIDIFCLHRDNPKIPVAEFMDALNEVKNDGLIGNIGASNWEMGRFAEARDYALKNNMEPFTVLSNNFSLAEMVDPVWPGCVGVNNSYLEYLMDNQIMLFPWSSQARGFFIEKKEITSNEHFSNPSLEEEMRVWHCKKNLQRRKVCFAIAAQRGVQPIQVALAYVIQKSSLIFPLVGPRTIMEAESSIAATKLNLTEEEMSSLAID
ncbi:aldo/keto reductase [Gammaproteobacteria bacterium]|jgi:aryl-alcohol dehydrogenase-like predicted oxidoreductase/predicted dehydrogenase|nr:aldo/keto reductase [Gammaproteobacteria bacterium]MDC0367846.1 aldo/keto reductase [Gammaproteobacteria bacterium]